MRFGLDSGPVTVSWPSFATSFAKRISSYHRFVFTFNSLALRRREFSAEIEPDTRSLGIPVSAQSNDRLCTTARIRTHVCLFPPFRYVVNMAARMESNCEPGRIQISQNTAEILAAAKKSSWFTPREDKVVAKGKGEVLTCTFLPSNGTFAKVDYFAHSLFEHSFSFIRHPQTG